MVLWVYFGHPLAFPVPHRSLFIDRIVKIAEVEAINMLNLCVSISHGYKLPQIGKAAALQLYLSKARILSSTVVVKETVEQGFVLCRLIGEGIVLHFFVADAYWNPPHVLQSRACSP